MLDTSLIVVFRRVRNGRLCVPFKLENRRKRLAKFIVGLIYVMLIFATAPSRILASPACDSEAFDNFVDQHKAIAENAHDRGDHRIALREYRLIAENFSRCAESDIAKRTQAGIQAGNTDHALLHQTHENESYGQVAAYYSFAADDARALHNRSVTCTLVLNELSALKHTDTHLDSWYNGFQSEVKACKT